MASSYPEMRRSKARLSAAARLLCSGFIVLRGNNDTSALSWLGPIAITLAQDLLADNVVDLCKDALEGELHIG